MESTLLTRSQKIILGINIVIILYFIGRDISLIKTCGGLINPWSLIDGSLFCLVIPSFLVYSIFLLRTQRKLAISIIILNIAFVTFIYYVRIDKLGFFLQKPLYEGTTRLIQAGKISAEDLHFPYTLLTACGEVIRHKEYIFYFTEIDYLDFSGYLHSENGSLPDHKFFNHPTPFDVQEACEQIDEKWFYCHFSD